MDPLDGDISEEGEEYSEQGEEDDENDEEDTMVPSADFVPHPPSQQQLSDIRFENNQFGRYRAILVDGENYRYRIHRRNRGDDLRWYRCVSRRSTNCRATACFDVAGNTIRKLSTAHNHSPPLFTRFVR